MGDTLPSPPFVDIPGLPNFRDLGGYPIASQPGKVIRRSVIFRSAEPSRLTNEGVDALKQLGITHVYDLRSLQEWERGNNHGLNRPVKEWEGANRIFAPVFRHEDYSPEAVALRFQNYGSGHEGFAQVYISMLAAAASPGNTARPYSQILEHLASDSCPPTPVLIHCTAGKDRTGVICALILSLCGVEDEIVAHEYSLTDLGLKCRHDEIVRHLVTEPAFKDNPAGAHLMILARKENMISLLDWIKKSHGSVEQCVVDLGIIKAEAIEKLRRNLIVDAPSTEEVNWKEHAELLQKEAAPV